jgi:hypothetical protein
VQQPKLSIPSFVGADCFDFGLFWPGKSLYEFVPFEALAGVESGDIVNDREKHFLHVRYAVSDGQCRRKDIEGASNRVDISARLNAEGERKRRFLDENKGVLRYVTINIFDSEIQILVDPIDRSAFEGWEIGIGPINGRFGIG